MLSYIALAAVVTCGMHFAYGLKAFMTLWDGWTGWVFGPLADHDVYVEERQKAIASDGEVWFGLW